MGFKVEGSRCVRSCVLWRFADVSGGWLNESCVAGLRCGGWLCVCAVGVELGFAAAKGHLGCVGLRICGCSAPWVKAKVAVERPRWALEPLVYSVCAAVGAARAAAVRWKAVRKAWRGVA